MNAQGSMVPDGFDISDTLEPLQENARVCASCEHLTKISYSKLNVSFYLIYS